MPRRVQGSVAEVCRARHGKACVGVGGRTRSIRAEGVAATPGGRLTCPSGVVLVWFVFGAKLL